MIGLIMMASFSFTTGAKLEAKCLSTDGADQLYCVAYVQGVSDGIQEGLLAADPNHTKTGVLCMPRGVTGQQIVDATKDYLRDHPQLRSSEASLSILGGLLSKWRCPGE